MPFVILIIGLMALVIGVRGQSTAAISLLQSEFTGSGSFIQWFIAIMILGLVGYYRPVRPVTDSLLLLVILSMVMANQSKNGLFKEFENALQNTKATAAPTSTPQPNTSVVLPVAASAGAAVTTATGSPALGQIVAGNVDMVGSNPLNIGAGELGVSIGQAFQNIFGGGSSNVFADVGNDDT
jgi:hypothetical protein